MSEYDTQAEQFLKETDTEFKAEFLKNGFHFQDDKETRDIYLITLKRGEREFKFNFGQSLNCSIKFKIIQGYLNNEIKAKMEERGLNTKGLNNIKELNQSRSFFIRCGKYWEENKEFEIPTAYDVLVSLTSYEVGSFEDFCGEFGYDTDSRKAEKTYKAVLEEWKNIKILYSDKEILKLQEIQQFNLNF